jgi:hypothetical protein
VPKPSEALPRQVRLERVGDGGTRAVARLVAAHAVGDEEYGGFDEDGVLIDLALEADVAQGGDGEPHIPELDE